VLLEIPRGNSRNALSRSINYPEKKKKDYPERRSRMEKTHLEAPCFTSRGRCFPPRRPPMKSQRKREKELALTHARRYKFRAFLRSRMCLAYRPRNLMQFHTAGGETALLHPSRASAGVAYPRRSPGRPHTRCSPAGDTRERFSRKPVFDFPIQPSPLESIMIRQAREILTHESRPPRRRKGRYFRARRKHARSFPSFAYARVDFRRGIPLGIPLGSSRIP